MNEDFFEWVEFVDDTVFAYFGEPLSDFEERFGVDMENYFELGYSVDQVISDFQDMIEEEEYEE